MTNGQSIISIVHLCLADDSLYLSRRKTVVTADPTNTTNQNQQPTKHDISDPRKKLI